MKKGILLVLATISISIAANAQKYGHADAQSMLTELPDYKLAEDSLKKFAAQLEAEMEKKHRNATIEGGVFDGKNTTTTTGRGTATRKNI